MNAMAGLVAALADVFLQSHAHGAGPRPAFYEYLIVAAAAVVMVWTVYLAVRMTARPGEDQPDHIKRAILEDREGGPDG